MKSLAAEKNMVNHQVLSFSSLSIIYVCISICLCEIFICICICSSVCECFVVKKLYVVRCDIRFSRHKDGGKIIWTRAHDTTRVRMDFTDFIVIKILYGRFGKIFVICIFLVHKYIVFIYVGKYKHIRIQRTTWE